MCRMVFAFVRFDFTSFAYIGAIVTSCLHECCLDLVFLIRLAMLPCLTCLLVRSPVIG